MDTGKQKKQPTDMSPFIEKLEAFWMKGMQACRTDEEKSLVSQAAAETGLNRRQIITWVNNKKAKLRGSVAKKRKISKRQKSGRDLYISQAMAVLPPGKERVRVANEKWSSICNTSEGARYKAEAKLIKKDNPATLDEDAAKSYFAAEHKKLTKILQNLEEIGYESLVVLYNKRNGSGYSLGTDAGQMYLGKNQRIGVEFTAFVGGEAEQLNRHRLKKKVRNLYAKLYKELTKEEKMSYEPFRQGIIRVQGLPEGVKVEGIDTYSRPLCKQILDSSSSISFHYTQQSSPHDGPTVNGGDAAVSSTSVLAVTAAPPVRPAVGEALVNPPTSVLTVRSAPTVRPVVMGPAAAASVGSTQVPPTSVLTVRGAPTVRPVVVGPAAAASVIPPTSVLTVRGAPTVRPVVMGPAAAASVFPPTSVLTVRGAPTVRPVVIGPAAAASVGPDVVSSGGRFPIRFVLTESGLAAMTMDGKLFNIQ